MDVVDTDNAATYITDAAVFFSPFLSLFCSLLQVRCGRACGCVAIPTSTQADQADFSGYALVDALVVKSKSDLPCELRSLISFLSIGTDKRVCSGLRHGQRG